MAVAPRNNITTLLWIKFYLRSRRRDNHSRHSIEEQMLCNWCIVPNHMRVTTISRKVCGNSAQKNALLC